MVAASTGLVLAADKIGKIKTTFQDLAIVALLIGVDFFGLLQVSCVINAIGIVCLGIATLLTMWSGISYVVKNRAVFGQTKL